MKVECDRCSKIVSADSRDVVKGLEFTKAMITFNPLTGEYIEPENLNEADKTTYDACVGAIALLKEKEVVSAVPVKVIESWLYSIALNNADNSLGDACEEIIKRLGGLERYNAERKDGDTDGKFDGNC